ncbi:Gfo/Idh/MocA family protein [Oleiharenicola sp. Vm1]|uniref:Gfo/Idh/MocA family protein n=1 Tax=Oleiharenicola sp. Vm1 TaxID=3398393 RepID=UPI0039F486E3
MLTYPFPIQLVGAGGIVRDAHLPAYRLAGFPVAGVFDLDAAKAAQLAADFGLPHPFPSLAAAVQAAEPGMVFDVAVPATAIEPVLRELPDGAAVLIQKPFGADLGQARALLHLCREKRLRAAVNFQLRFAPAIVAARRLIAAGTIGEVHDLEVRVTVHMPWHLWSFLANSPRLEILYHSIHYVDLIRSFLGEPRGVHAKTVRHPATPHLAATRTTMALDYGDLLRATITTNHAHDYGPRHQESYVKWEGTRGVIRAQLGVLLNYPQGGRDALELCLKEPGQPAGEWREIPVDGTWFPHAFIGTMDSLQRYAAGATTELPTRVDDAFRTMAVVEAAYASSASGATPIPSS